MKSPAFRFVVYDADMIGGKPVPLAGFRSRKDAERAFPPGKGTLQLNDGAAGLIGGIESHAGVVAQMLDRGDDARKEVKRLRKAITTLERMLA